MNNIYLRNRLSLVQKIALAGLFIALVTILQKVVAINYIPVTPFVRISFGGCALIIYSSILLGPWFGLAVGAFSDLLGYLVFDPKTLGFFPQITAIYALMGLVSYFIFVGVRFIKSSRMMMIVEYGVFLALALTTTLVVTLNNDLGSYHIENWHKIVIPVATFSFFILLFVINFFTARYFKKKDDDKTLFNVYQVSFACFIIEVVVMIIFGTLMKGSAFGFHIYLAILISQILVAAFNIPINTFLISYIMRLTKRLY